MTSPEPPKKYDYTAKARQRQRRTQLDRVARYLGYTTWTKLETAVITGEISLSIQASLGGQDT